MIINYDTNFGSPSIIEPLAGKEIDTVVHQYFAMIDEYKVEVDSIWWCWLDGNYALYPSKILPMWELYGFKKWWNAGIYPIRVFVEETKKRKKEVFFSYRLNGTDMASIKPLSKPLLKESHPEWLIQSWESYGNPGYWNFAEKGVRDYKLSILRDIAENYDYDGLEIDFARVPVNLPPGYQWENRRFLTKFMQSLRKMTLEVEKHRGRPFLLAARIPENIEGCHFDGIDIEKWASEQLIDILVLGNRSFDVDITAFRRITMGTEIKLYPCIDDHHATDGYLNPPIDVFRGVCANWWHQGADGIQTFNFEHSTSDSPNIYSNTESKSKLHLQVYKEIIDPKRLKYRNKTFVLQRRGGGHGPTVIPNPEDWSTPRWMYYLTNMFAPLPTILGNDGKVDTLVMAYISDDLGSESEKIVVIHVRILLSDLSFGDQSKRKCLQPATIAANKVHHLKTIPLEVSIVNQIELRLNNALLPKPIEDQGWLIFSAKPNQFAVGNNLIGVCIKKGWKDGHHKVSLEKLEIQVNYQA